MNWLAPAERMVSCASGIFTGLVGATVLFAWHARITSLIQLAPNWAPMQYNTAICFLLLGAGFVLVRGKRFARVLSLVFAFLALLISALTLFQYIFHINLGLDELFVQALSFPNVSHPGRMAPNTAICAILASLAVLYSTEDFRLPQRSLIVSTLAALIGGIAMVSLFGYWQDLPQTYQWNGLTAMAMHTGLSFVVLSAGLMARALGQSYQEKVEIPQWLPVSVALTGLSISMILGQSIALNEDHQVKAALYEKLQRAVSMIELGIAERESSIARLAKRWSAANPLHLSHWKMDAELYLKDFVSLRCLYLLDSKFRVRRQAFAKPHPDFCKNETFDVQVQKIRQAKNRGKKNASSESVEFYDGNGMLDFVAPAVGGGWVLARFDVAALLEEFLPSPLYEASGFMASFGAYEVYRRAWHAKRADHRWVQSAPLNEARLKGWTLFLLPTEADVETLRSNTARTALLLGSLLSLLIATLFHLWRRRSQAPTRPDRFYWKQDNEERVKLGCGSCLNTARLPWQCSI